MALYGGSYDSIGQQRQFYDNMALRMAEQQRIGQQQGFENQMTQRRMNMGMQEAAQGMAMRRRAQDNEMGLERLRALANIMLRQEQIGVDRSRVSQQSQAAKMRAQALMADRDREMSDDEFGLAQEAIKGQFGSGQRADLEQLAPMFPRLSPQQRAALLPMTQDYNRALEQNQRSVLGATALINQISSAEKLLSQRRRENTGDRSKGEKLALSSEITSLNEEIARLNEQAKAIPNDIRSKIIMDPTRGVAMPNMQIESGVADSVEQWRSIADVRLAKLESDIKGLGTQYKPGSDDYTANVLPVIMERNRLKAAVDAGPIPFSTRWNSLNGPQDKVESVRVYDLKTGRGTIMPRQALLLDPNWQSKFRLFGPE
jgi:hypothetical protein